jgi:hypothetical protein
MGWDVFQPCMDVFVGDYWGKRRGGPDCAVVSDSSILGVLCCLSRQPNQTKRGDDEGIENRMFFVFLGMGI